jgi:hypothetical protein
VTAAAAATGAGGGWNVFFAAVMISAFGDGAAGLSGSFVDPLGDRSRLADLPRPTRLQPQGSRGFKVPRGFFRSVHIDCICRH